MMTFYTPKGKAGSDQLLAMEESVNTQLEQMFQLHTKLNVLTYGIGRTTLTTEYGSEATIRRDAQRNACDDGIVFHAGRAIELAMSIVYARGVDRILGREYPDVSVTQMKRDRASHCLHSLYQRIRQDLSAHNMVDAFEDIYQQALHEGIVDVVLDEKVISSVLLRQDSPFWEVRNSKIMDGAELTLDHSKFDDLFTFLDGTSKFMQIPADTFEQFLAKADALYYETDLGTKRRRSMRWSHYAARDNEYSRPRVTIGIRFFGRLIKAIVELSNQQWMWDERFLRRWHERRQYNIKKLMEIHVMQNFNAEISFPEMISVEDAMKHILKSKASENLKRGYDNLHTKWPFKTKDENEEVET